MELVTNNSDQDIAKAKAKEDVEYELTDFAVNFLRVVARAGNPWSIFGDMVDCVKAAQAYYDVHGHYPHSHEIAGILDCDKPEQQRLESWSNRHPERWDNGTYLDTTDAEMAIRQASLRIIAAQIAGQLTVEQNASRLFHNNLRALEDIHEARRKALNPVKPKVAKAKPTRSKRGRRAKRTDDDDIIL